MGEFELIAAIQAMANGLPANGFEGIGDDCAVLEIGIHLGCLVRGGALPA